MYDTQHIDGKWRQTETENYTTGCIMTQINTTRKKNLSVGLLLKTPS